MNNNKSTESDPKANETTNHKPKLKPNQTKRKTYIRQGAPDAGNPVPTT